MRARLTLLATLAAAASLGAQNPVPDRGAAALAAAIAGLGTTARVLVVGAHPDDEDTRLIAWLARGRHVETAYLSLTRGEGGQNLVGDELGEALGVVRTEELLAARRVDGAHQYFTRAIDYGFSKSADEAFRHWPHEEILKDVVTVVRAFRPHVIVAIFTGTTRDGHGQHQASGILAREAYDAAGDTVRFPRAATGALAGWTPLKFYRARSYLNHQGATYAYDAGELDPLLGRSYAELAAISRSQHRSQAMGVLQHRGPSRGSLLREATRVNEATPAAREQGVFDGIDTTWARLGRAPLTAIGRESLAHVAELVKAAREALDVYDPSRVSAPLSALVTRLSLVCGEFPSCSDATPEGRDAERSVRGGMRRAQWALRLAAGIDLDVTVAREHIPAGTFERTALAVYDRGSDSGVVMRRAVIASRDAHGRVERDVDEPPLPAGGVFRDTLPLRAAALTQPWWLAAPRTGDFYGVAIDSLAEDERVNGGASGLVDVRLLRSEAYDGAPVRVEEEVVFRYADPARGEIRRPVAVVPMVSVTVDRVAEYAQANVPLDRTVRVTLRSADAAPREVRVLLELPRGLAADSASRTITLPRHDAVRTVEFRLRGRLPAGRHVIRARAESGGRAYTQGYTLIDHEHIRPQRVYRDATLDVQAVDVALPNGLTVAYVHGVSDNVPPILRELGIAVTELKPGEIPTTELSRFGVVVVGPRAYEASPELVQHNARLLDWVQKGGTMVVQYGQQEMQQPGILPYPIQLGRPANRVTDEAAPVRILDSRSALLSTPNRIGDDDFAGWVQDRTLYMPSTFDERWSAPLETHDPGEPPNRGALLVAPYGRGTFVYTTLAFFRQLPAGVPGAARLFVNLLAAGSVATP